MMGNVQKPLSSLRLRSFSRFLCSRTSRTIPKKIYKCRVSRERQDREDRLRGRDESERHRAESQWIVAARPLCHLQYPVAYLSRLQRILPAARWELRFKAALAALPPRGLHQRHVPLGTRRSLLQVGNRAAGARVALARILT
jgi:hypothetical protein